MEELLNHIKKNWGKPQYCAHCQKEPTAVCGSCYEYAYCGTSCQTNHWLKEHRFQCINGIHDLDDAQPPGKQDDEDKKEINITELGKDVLNYITKYLSLKDLDNFSVINKALQKSVRQTILKRRRFVITPIFITGIEENRAEYKEIIQSISAVKISAPKDLQILINAGANITDVKLDDEFYGDISLPDTVTHFTMGYWYNRKIVLPNTLTHFTMGNNFNRGIVLPGTLTHFIMGNQFDQQIDLPKGLSYFQMGIDFNQPIDLPASLTYFRMRGEFNQPIELPLGLTHLILGPFFNQRIRLPNSLVYFAMGSYFNQPIQIPYGLKYLIMGVKFNQPIDLPNTVTHLTLGLNFKRSIDFPASLIYVKFRKENRDFWTERIPLQVKTVEWYGN